jgi:hypothetical protein
VSALAAVFFRISLCAFGYLGGVPATSEQRIRLCDTYLVEYVLWVLGLLVGASEQPERRQRTMASVSKRPNSIPSSRSSMLSQADYLRNLEAACSHDKELVYGELPNRQSP